MSGVRSVALPLALALACAHSPEPSVTTSSPQQAFEALSRDYLERSLALSPTEATLLGASQEPGS